MADKLPVNTQHGGAGALKAIQRGKEFTGLALTAQRDMEDRLALSGAIGEIIRDAGRLQVCSDLYFDAVIKALQDGQVEKATSLIGRWGWIHNSSIRAWDLIRKIKQPDDMAEANKIIEHYRQELQEGEGDPPSDS